MAEKKSSKAKNDSDSKKTGNSCGFSIGCLIIVVTVIVVIYFLFVKPALEERGYSLEDLHDKALDLKDRAAEKYEEVSSTCRENKEKLEDVRDRAEEQAEKVEDKIEEVSEKAEDTVRDLDIDSRARGKLDKNAPRLIEDR